jgi:hypothetical protein
VAARLANRVPLALGGQSLGDMWMNDHESRIHRPV